ncbi:MAG TPA: hypothetical protein VIK94_01780 [Bacilli bacterium]
MRRKFAIIIIISFVLLFTSIVIFSNTKSTNENDSRLGEQYQKPKTDDVVQIPEIREKEWFEYVEFDKYNPQIYLEGKTKYMLYTPADFSLATIMKVSPLTMSLEFGDNLSSTTEYATASSVEVSYERSSGYAWGYSGGAEFEFSFKLIEKVKISIDGHKDWHYDETVSISRSFDAILINGEIIPWRIVQYQVQLPVFIEIYEDNRLVKEGYYICNLMSGLCREWADGYIEHWSTGKRVTVDDFYGEYFKEENLKKILRSPW